MRVTPTFSGCGVRALFWNLLGLSDRYLRWNGSAPVLRLNLEDPDVERRWRGSFCDDTTPSAVMRFPHQPHSLRFTHVLAVADDPSIQSLIHS